MRIAFVGASGYGNIGDDTYPLVFKDLFQGHDTLFFNSDIPRAKPEGIGMLIMGGGGILHNVGRQPDTEMSHHFWCMRHYMDWALKARIPLGFLSCGFQFRAGGEPFYREALQLWTPYLAKAAFVALRSPRCVEIAAELTGRQDIAFLPDAAYLYSPVAPTTRASGDTLTIVPAGTVAPADPFTQRLIRFSRSMDYRVVWLSMGALNDDSPVLTEARRLDPSAKIELPGSPREAFERVAGSRIVLSGRYHGIVFARKSRVPFVAPESAPYKLANENFAAAISTKEDYARLIASFIK